MMDQEKEREKTMTKVKLVYSDRMMDLEVLDDTSEERPEFVIEMTEWEGRELKKVIASYDQWQKILHSRKQAMRGEEGS